MWQIVINGPGYFDTSYDLPDGITTLGRADDNDIVLSGDLVSRKHATLSARGGALTFEDLGSRNGSRVNGQPAKAPQTLKSGDTVSLGENILSVRAAVARAVADRASTRADTNVRSSIILSKSVTESVVLRALDNIFPLGTEDTPSQSTPVAPRSSGGHSAYEVAYESLLLITRVAELLATSATSNAFLEGTLDLLMRIVGASTGVILVRQDGADLQPAAMRHRGKLTQGQVPISRAIVDEAMGLGEALVVADVRGDPRFSKRESVVLYGAGQALCIPLGQKRPFEGALYLNRPMSSSEGLEGILDVCTAVAHLLATGIEKFRASDASGAKVQAAADRSFPPEPGGKRASGASERTELERGVSTVLFADLAGFSAAARRLEAPAISEILQRFYACFAEVVWSFEGWSASSGTRRWLSLGGPAASEMTRCGRCGPR
jgi:pSer/pThr/pTyr-binding forkhead associated (FHA) protein